MRPRDALIASVVAVTAVGLTAACTDDSTTADGSATSTTAPTTTAPTTTSPGAPSIVVLGDSVAAGEGIAYDYRYELDRADPNRSSWGGGTKDPGWDGDHPLCHQDDDAYGHLVAAQLGAELTTFACTGATYLEGITAPETEDGATMRPAQFGDWSTGTDLNAAYDAADPDVVVVTLGADDVEFSSIIRYCVSGFTTGESFAVAALAAAADPIKAIAEVLDAKAPKIAADIESGDRTLHDDVGSSYCTAEHPGEPIEQLFWEPIRSGQITRHYRDLVAAIQARGRDPRHGRGKIPKIVFTTYHRPLPADLDGQCWDVFPLAADEQSYLQSLQDTLQATLLDAVRGLEGVSVADISRTMDGHEWCTEDPWTYGLSVIWFDDSSSKAPFHPTPDGQRAIASVVAGAVDDAMARG